MQVHDGLRLTERDLDMFHSLSTARYLTVEALEWLHFPSWLDRWQQAQEQPGQRRYISTSAVYTRLRKLRGAGFLHCLAPTISISIDRYHRDPLIWTLSQRGADVLSQVRRIPADDLWYEEPRERSFLTLLHGSAVGRCYAALTTKINSMAGLAVEHWQGDHLLSRDYDHIGVRVPAKGGSIREEKLPVLPDAAFKLVHPKGVLLCFIELDRGRPLESWRTKIRAYATYMGSKLLHTRYGVESFVLLTLTTTEQQRQRLMRSTADVLGQASDRYLFGLIDAIHPLTIGGCWEKTTSVIFAQQAGVGGHLHRSAEISTASHTFLR